MRVTLLLRFIQIEIVEINNRDNSHELLVCTYPFILFMRIIELKKELKVFKLLYI